jgi:hypothetical protein
MSCANCKIPSAPNDKRKFVLLRGVLEANYFDKFFTTYFPEEDPTKLQDGTTAYAIIGYADSVAEAQMILYGRIYPIKVQRRKA